MKYVAAIERLRYPQFEQHFVYLNIRVVDLSLSECFNHLSLKQRGSVFLTRSFESAAFLRVRSLGCPVSSYM